MMNAQTKVCPFCAETIKSAAVICRYCSSNLSTGVAANGKGQAAAGAVAGSQNGGWKMQKLRMQCKHLIETACRHLS